MPAVKPEAASHNRGRRRGGVARSRGLWWDGTTKRFVTALLAGALLSGALLLAAAARGAPSATSAGSAPYAAPCSARRQLAYVAADYSGQKGMVWLAAANGSGGRRLLRAAAPVLAPSGRLIAVTQFGRSAGLGIFTVCGGLVGQYFSSHDAISGVAWSPDSSLVAAIVDPHPNGSVFGQRLVVIDVATGHLTTVATGFLDGFGGPSFSRAAPYRLAYAVVPRVDAHTNVWTAAIGQPSAQLTRGGDNDYPLWGPQGMLYEHFLTSGLPELELFSSGHATGLMRLNGWPVALSSDGLHLAAEGAACGVVWPLSVNLATRKVVHQFADGFAPFGISASGGSLLIAGSPPSADCGGPRSVIETVPFAGGKPKVIAHGTNPSWADSTAVSVQSDRSAASTVRASRRAATLGRKILGR